MKPISHISFLLLSLFLFACKAQKRNSQIIKISEKCSYCDSLLNSGIFKYPYREIDKNIEGIPLLQERNPTGFNDSMQVYTEFEVAAIEGNLYCLLGLNKDSVNQLFHPNIHRELWKNSGERQSIGFYYNKGNYIDAESNNYTVVPYENDGTEFWLLGGGHFMLDFSKMGSDFIYTGTIRDSVLLNDWVVY